MNLKLIFLTLMTLTFISSLVKAIPFLVAVLVLGKISLILFYFMELRHAERVFLIGIGGFILSVSFVLLLV